MISLDGEHFFKPKCPQTAWLSHLQALFSRHLAAFLAFLLPKFFDPKVCFLSIYNPLTLFTSYGVCVFTAYLKLRAAILTDDHSYFHSRLVSTPRTVGLIYSLWEKPFSAMFAFQELAKVLTTYMLINCVSEYFPEDQLLCTLLCVEQILR